MGRQVDFQRIERLISRWITEIRFNNAVDFYDINRVAEDIARQLLNKIYNYDLVNLNDDEQRNYPGIDLGDRGKKIAFQITSRSDIKKIKDSLQKFKEKGAEKYSNGIRFLILSDKKPKFNKTQKKAFKEIYSSFNPEEHILTVVDLVQKILRLCDEQSDRFREIRSFLEEEFADWKDSKGKKREHKCGNIKKSENNLYPFRGLNVFREEDQRIFFGRKDAEKKVMDKLKTNRFLAVLGPSGCGKSSLVQAGLIPHLRKHALVTLMAPNERQLKN